MDALHSTRKQAFRFMQATAKTAMRRVLGIRIRGGQGETLVLILPTAVAGASRDPGGEEGFVLRARSVLSSD